ncbi:MAG: 2-phospho-L-lactate guanylyltransferase [Solirubrobacterales bacterium]
MKTTAIIPVKSLDAALRRLEGTLGPAERERLAEALFLDLIAKLPRSSFIDDTLVVTADPSVSRQARWLGNEVLEQSGDNGHPEAAIAGARAATEAGADRVAMLAADCPLLDVEELDRHLGRTPQAALIVPDRHGTGTNALVLSPPDAIEPAFGLESCSRHISRARAAGIGFTLERIESLAMDLDTPEDMRDLRDRLLLDPDPAPRTAKVLWELGAQPEPAVA